MPTVNPHSFPTRSPWLLVLQCYYLQTWNSCCDHYLLEECPTCAWADVPFVWVGRMSATSVWAVQYVISMLCSTEVFVRVVCLRRCRYILRCIPLDYHNGVKNGVFPTNKKGLFGNVVQSWLKVPILLIDAVCGETKLSFLKMFKCGCLYILTWSLPLQQCSWIA